jgi:hypothetical protein
MFYKSHLNIADADGAAHDGRLYEIFHPCGDFGRSGNICATEDNARIGRRREKCKMGLPPRM